MDGGEEGRERGGQRDGTFSGKHTQGAIWSQHLNTHLFKDSVQLLTMRRSCDPLPVFTQRTLMLNSTKPVLKGQPPTHLHSSSDLSITVYHERLFFPFFLSGTFGNVSFWSCVRLYPQEDGDIMRHRWGSWGKLPKAGGKEEEVKTETWQEDRTVTIKPASN